MNKTLIALAVSAAVAAPAAQAVEFDIGEDTTIGVGGTLEPIYTSVNDANGDSASEFGDNDSTLQFDGEHRWNANTTGFFHIEYEWNFDEDVGGVDDLESAWLGAEGDFGMVRLGTYDTLYENNVAELIDEFEVAALTEEEDGGEGDQITYVSPRFGGFQFGAEARVVGDGEDDNATGDSGTGVSLMARYDMDNWGVVAGVDDRGAITVDTDNDGVDDDFNDESTAGFGGWVGFGAFTVSARFAAESSRGDDNDVEYAGLMGGSDYGAGEVFVGVQDVSPDQGDSRTEFSAIVKHALYDNLDVFVEIGQFDKANDADDVTAVGAIYSF